MKTSFLIASVAFCALLIPFIWHAQFAHEKPAEVLKVDLGEVENLSKGRYGFPIKVTYEYKRSNGSTQRSVSETHVGFRSKVETERWRRTVESERSILVRTSAINDANSILAVNHNLLLWTIMLIVGTAVAFACPLFIRAWQKDI